LFRVFSFLVCLNFLIPSCVNYSLFFPFLLNTFLLPPPFWYKTIARLSLVEYCVFMEIDVVDDGATLDGGDRQQRPTCTRCPILRAASEEGSRAGGYWRPPSPGGRAGGSVDVAISVCTQFLKLLLAADEKQPFLIGCQVIPKLSIATSSRRRTSLWITTMRQR
jgi:hypothetical protein